MGDINKFTIAVDDYVAGLHKVLHNATGLKYPDARGGIFNYKWEQFIDANPNATKDDVFKFAVKLKVEFGIYGPYQDF